MINIGIGALILIAALAAFSLDMVLSIKNRDLEIARMQIADLHRIDGGNQSRMMKMSEDLKQRTAALSRANEDLKQRTVALSRANEDLKKLEAERVNLKKQNAGKLEALDKASEDLRVTKVKVDSLNTNKTETAKIKGATRTDEVQFAMREEVASHLEPIAYVPSLQIPPKIAIVQDTKVPVMQNRPGDGVLTFKSGQSLPVVRADEDVVLVEIAGEKLRIPKQNTDFNAALDAANLSRHKENERLYNERELLIDKMVEQEKLAKESLMKSKGPVNMRVVGFLAGGVLVQKTDEVGRVLALLTGVDVGLMAIGDPWRGDVFPMGLFMRPGTDEKYRHYTADWKEFAAFVKAGSQQDPVSRQVLELEIKKAKEVFDQVQTLQKEMNTDLLIKEGAGELALESGGKEKEGRIALAKENFFKNHAAKMEKGFQLAINLSKNPSLDPKLKSLLQEVAAAYEVFQESDLTSFVGMIRGIEVHANAFKGALILSIKNWEDQSKE